MAEIPRALYYGVGPDYPSAMQIPLLRGRYLSESDTLQSEIAILIDNLMARRFFPGRDPVGQALTIPHWGVARNVSGRIVGVLGHVEQYGIDGSGGEKPQIYFSLYQLPDDALPTFRNVITFAVRTRLDPADVLPAIKATVHGSSADQPVYNVRTMRDLVSGSMARQRLPMVLLAAFAGLALVLATIGIYAVISYSTAQRQPEIGIRMALGAEVGDVRRMVVAEGMRLAGLGILIGLAGTLSLSRLLTALLFGVKPYDPLTCIAVAAILAVTTLIACWVPAVRATRVDPLVALRHE
jgi:predicted permease